MARSAATLGVSVTAKTKGFRKGMKRSQTAFQKFRGAVKRGIGTLAKFGAATAAVGVAGMAILVKRSMAAIDTLAKLASRIDTTTESLVGLQHAAELTGAGAGLMAKSLDVMAKRLGEAAMGTGEAKDAIKALGLDVNKLMAMDPAKAFAKISDAFVKLGTQAEKSAVASKIFSRAGLALVNTLDLGSEGLEQIERRTIAMGTAFSKVDAAKVEAANDALFELGQEFVGLGNRIAIGLAPYIEAIAKSTSAFVQKFRAAFVLGLGFLIDTLVSGFDELLVKIKEVKAAAQNAGAGLLGTAAKMAKAVGLDDLALGLGANSILAGVARDKTLAKKTFSLKQLMKDVAAEAQFQAEGATSDKDSKSFWQRMLGEDAMDKVGDKMTEKIRAWALSIGKTLNTAAGPGGGLLDLLNAFTGAAKSPAAAMASVGPASFREVDVSRMAIGGIQNKASQVQKVTDPEANAIATKIEANTRGPQVAAAG